MQVGMRTTLPYFPEKAVHRVNAHNAAGLLPGRFPLMDESTLCRRWGMFGGDYSRKRRELSPAPQPFDKRPLKFEEFEAENTQKISFLATPGEYESASTPAV